MTNKQQAKDNLKNATSGMPSGDIERLSLAEVYAFVDIEELTGTLVRNIQRSIVVQAKQREEKGVANDIVTRMKAQFPDIVAIPKRGQIIKVWLNGLPKEIE